MFSLSLCLLIHLSDVMFVEFVRLAFVFDNHSVRWDEKHVQMEFDVLQDIIIL